MPGRLGFAGRLVLILLALMLAFAALAVAVSYTARERRAATSERFPIPAQVAAIVALVEGEPKVDPELLVRAARTDAFSVAIASAAPAPVPADQRLPTVEWLIGQYLETLPDRAVVAHRPAPPADGTLARLADRLDLTGRTPIAIAIELVDGRWASFELRGNAVRRVFGVPAGFWIGVLGFLFAAAALWAILREARPLAELAASAEDFSTRGEPSRVSPRGAPDIRRLIDASNAMQTRIAALIKGRSMLIGAIGHDLKTYITRLRLRVEAIEPDEQRERAARDLDDMTAMIDEALALARGTGAPDRREPVDLADLIDHAVAGRLLAAIERAPSPAGPPVHVSGDPVALARVIGNLLDNAGRYAARCRVALAREGSWVSVAVEDDGPGIPEAEREAVFEPFYRLERSRNRATGGTGLGLAIARQIVEAHGGTITLDRSPALGGARFVVRLPAA
jgi:two-component system osmolarity sensor histidine kinase EnvZ